MENKKKRNLAVNFLLAVCAVLVVVLGFNVSLTEGSATKPEKKKEEYHWTKEVSIKKMEETVIDGNNLCLMTVEKENEKVTFRTSERVCDSLRESQVEKVDIAYDGSMVIKDLNMYVMGEKVKYK